KERHWNLAGLVRTGSYPAEQRKLLIDLKYAGRQRNVGPLAARIADALRSEPWISEVEALVPVPMHWFRRLQRPCNHAYELGRAVGRAAGIPLLNACRRVRYNPSQTTAKSRSERLKNVTKCFGMRWRANVRGMTICIVDNLLVTGATVCEVSKVLRKAGAKKIYAAVAARTVSAGDFQAADEAVAAVGD
ncbi:MAG: ComF family protein, partial [Planctomycetes bacterium]|nr:ComF family protein [Planctomycetota bacterium]